jgi:hypothetical protein
MKSELDIEFDDDRQAKENNLKRREMTGELLPTAKHISKM